MQDKSSLSVGGTVKAHPKSLIPFLDGTLINSNSCSGGGHGRWDRVKNIEIWIELQQLLNASVSDLEITISGNRKSNTREG